MIRVKLFLLVAPEVALQALGQESGPGVGLILLKSPVHWHVLNTALPTGFVLPEIHSQKRSRTSFFCYTRLNVSN